MHTENVFRAAPIVDHADGFDKKKIQCIYKHEGEKEAECSV
jgi:hypothetical protein